MRLSLLMLGALSLAACDAGSKGAPPPSESAAALAPAASAAPSPDAPAERFGAPIDAAAAHASLTDVAKDPGAFTGKTFATTGTIKAVCQRKGCWMELEDDAGQAHVKMAGYAFFVPKTAAGRKARVVAKLVGAEEAGGCGGGHEGHAHAEGEPGKQGKSGCRAAAEAELGRPLAKLELLADGIELL